MRGSNFWDTTASRILKVSKQRYSFLNIFSEKYKTLRAQWEGLTAEQEEYCTTLRERRSLIAKDVTRTDPTRLDEEQIQRLRYSLVTIYRYKHIDFQ